MKKSSFLICYAYVGYMIERMMSEKKRVFKVTTHKNYCLFYHDALSLMTEKETRKWRKEKGNEKMLILTEMNLFASDPVLKFYRGCPPENIPKLFHLDYFLNKYLYKAVDFYVRYTHS